MFNKLLALIALQRSSSNGLLLKQLLEGVGSVIFLSLTTAFLASILIAGTVCLGYNLLITYGLNEHAAMITLGFLILLGMMALALTATYYVRKIEQTTKQLLMIEHPITSRATSLIGAFMDGFQRRRARI